MPIIHFESFICIWYNVYIYIFCKWIFHCSVPFVEIVILSTLNYLSIILKSKFCFSYMSRSISGLCSIN